MDLWTPQQAYFVEQCIFFYCISLFSLYYYPHCYLRRGINNHNHTNISKNKASDSTTTVRCSRRRRRRRRRPQGGISHRMSKPNVSLVKEGRTNISHNPIITNSFLPLLALLVVADPRPNPNKTNKPIWVSRTLPISPANSYGWIRVGSSTRQLSRD